MSKGKDYLQKIKANANNDIEADKNKTNPRKGASYWSSKGRALKEEQNIDLGNEIGNNIEPSVNFNKRKKGKYDYLIATKEDEVKDSLIESAQNVKVQEILTEKEPELSERELMHKNDNLSAVNRFKVTNEQHIQESTDKKPANKFERLKENLTNEDIAERSKREQEARLERLQKFKEDSDVLIEQSKRVYEPEIDTQNNNDIYTQDKRDTYMPNNEYAENIETRNRANETTHRNKLTNNNYYPSNNGVQIDNTELKGQNPNYNKTNENNNINAENNREYGRLVNEVTGSRDNNEYSGQSKTVNRETDTKTEANANNGNSSEILDKMKSFNVENPSNNSNSALSEPIINRNVEEGSNTLLINKMTGKKNKGITGGIGSNKESNENIVNLLGIVSEKEKKQEDTSVPTRVTLRENMDYVLAYVPKSISAIVPEIVQVTIEDEMKLGGEEYLVVRKPRTENEVK